MPAVTTEPDLGLYVHVPFCERVCPYCDFAVIGVGSLDRAREHAYVEGLLRELDILWREHEPDLAGRPLATVYLGGGTPSLLRPDSVERLLRAFEARFARSETAEMTLELNPGTFEVERAPAFRGAGVTRLSVGVQSFHDATLTRLGRAHKGADALRGLEACLSAGFASLSADLISAAPEQTEEELLEDAGRLIELGVPHVSAYALSVEPGTPFARARQRGQLRLPDEDTAARMSRRLRAALQRAGYRQYELSSFALRGHRSRHNQRYWQCRDVLGLGVSAASLLGRHRFQNTRDPRRWEREVAAGRSPLAESRQIAPPEARADFLGLGFRRLDGVSRAEFRRRFGEPPEACFGRELAELRALGLISDAAGFLRLTERGVAFADEVFLRFVGPLTPTRRLGSLRPNAGGAGGMAL